MARNPPPTNVLIHRLQRIANKFSAQLQIEIVDPGRTPYSVPVWRAMINTLDWTIERLKEKT